MSKEIPTRPGLAALWLGALAAAHAAGQPGEPGSGGGLTEPPGPQAATVPFTLDHNRMTVEVEFRKADGTWRKAVAWVDLGSQFVLVGEALARDLGLDLSGLETSPRKAWLDNAQESPLLRVGGIALDVRGIKVLIRPGTEFRLGVVAEAMLPASALRHDHVVFDYPARRLTIARPGALEPRGVGVPCRFNPETGLVQVDATIDGRTVAFGLDNGSAGTWVSTALTSEWQVRHPDWPYAVGAAGSANFWGIDLETSGVLMRLPEIRIGGVTMREIAILGIAQPMFDWYSTKSAGPVVGFIGTNALGRYRVEIDFPNTMTYWQAGPASDANDLDIVGLTIRVEHGGVYTIAGVVTKNGVPAVAGVKPGDTLVSIGSLVTGNARMGDVIDALRGRPGEIRSLVVRRDGTLIPVEAKVTRLP